MADISKIARELVAYCRQGNFQQAYDNLYDKNAYSVEPQGEPPRVEGMDAILEKGEWWAQNFDVHNIEVSEPLVGDKYFAVTFFMDVSSKETGERTRDTEVAVYEVEDGKIVGEQFFY